MTDPQTCRCGRPYGPGSDEKRRHQMLQGHPPTPERVTPVADDLDTFVRMREAAQRDARRTGGAR